MARPARVSLDRILAAAAVESSARGYAGARVDLKAFRKVHPLAAYFSMLPPIVVYLVGAPIRREMAAQHPADIASPTPDAFVQHVQETMHHALACGATAESRPSACTPCRNPFDGAEIPPGDSAGGVRRVRPRAERGRCPVSAAPGGRAARGSAPRRRRARHDAVGKSGGRRRARGGANRRGSFRRAPFNRTPVPASSETIRFDADVQFHVVMSSEELGRAGLDSLAKKWSKRLLCSKAKRRLF